MAILNAYKVHDNCFDINPLPINRDWMDATSEKHAYRCFPVTLANTLGWYLSAKEDISFIWDGVVDQTNQHVTFTKGERYAYSGRGQGTISFYTGLIFRSQKNISLLAFNPPNFFNPDYVVVSSIISTSFYQHDFPLAIRALQPNKEITIKAGEPIAAILPISLGTLKEESIILENFIAPEGYAERTKSYGDAAQKINMSGDWTDWYRKAVDENGNSVGEHEVSSLRLQVIDKSKEK